MIAAYAIGWLVLLLIAIFLVFRLVGMSMMVNFFEVRRRWWHLPAQLASLAIFAAVVLAHPF